MPVQRGRLEEEDLHDEEADRGALRHGDPQQRPPEEGLSTQPVCSSSGSISIQRAGGKGGTSTNTTYSPSTTQKGPEGSSVPEVFYTPEPSPTGRESDAAEMEGENTPVFQFVDPDIQLDEDSLKTLEAQPPDPATPRRVFLEATFKEGYCPMMPHSIYCLPFWPSI